jgi:hypothetical protein
MPPHVDINLTCRFLRLLVISLVPNTSGSEFSHAGLHVSHNSTHWLDVSGIA